MKRLLCLLALVILLTVSAKAQTNTNAVATTLVTFSFQLGQTISATNKIQVTAPSGVTWTITTSGGSWLTADSTTYSGAASGTIAANATGLAAGTYQATATVNFSSGTPSKVDVPIILYVTPPFTFNAQAGSTSTPPQTFSVNAPRGFSTTILTFPQGSWLTVSPQSGAGSTTITLNANPTGLAAGTYSGSVYININGAGTEALNVTLNIGGPLVSATPASLTFTTTQGQNPPPQKIMLGTGSTSPLMWTSSLGFATNSTLPAWMQLSPSAGNFGTAPQVTINSELYPAGTYSGSISFNSTGTPSSLKVPVTLNINPASTAPGSLQVAPLSIDLSGIAGSALPRTATIQVSNPGSAPLAFGAACTTENSGNWLTCTPSSGSASAGSPATVSVTANGQSLQPGVYKGAVRLTRAGTDDVVVPVQFSDSGATFIKVYPNALLFNAAQGNRVLPDQIFSISVDELPGSGGFASWTAAVVQGSDFLKISPTSGNVDTQGPRPVTVTADATGAKAGVRYGLIRVTQLNAKTYDVVVILNVIGTPAGPTVSPAGLLFVGPQGGPAPPAQNVTYFNPLAQQNTFNWTTQVNTGGQWLSVTPSSVSPGAGSSGTEQVSVAPGTLLPGVYAGTVSLVPGDGSLGADVNTFFCVTPKNEVEILARGPAATCTPSKIVMVERRLAANFSSSVGWPTNLETQVIDDCGTALTGATVIATFSNGDAPLALVHIGGGVYSGTWKPAMAAPATVTLRALAPPLPPVSQIIGGQVNANPNPPPFVAPGGVVNGASFTKSGGLAPGAIVSVFGTNLATGTNGASFPLPTSLGNIKLTMGGTDMPLFFSNSGQVNAQVPYELPTFAQTSVVARAGSGAAEADGVPETVTIAAVQPGVFLAAPPSMQGVILNNPGLQVVDANHAATAGDVLTIYCTGLGATTPPVQTGMPAPSNPPATVGGVNTVTVTIGGVSAPVQFAGLTPGFVGLYQVNVAVPAGVNPGSAVPVILTQNGVNSPMVTIAIR